MNKKTIAWVIVIVVILGLLIYAVAKSPSEPGTTVTPNPNTNQNPPVVTQSTIPVAVTNNTVFPTGTTAIVSGSVIPKGALTSYWYEYGESTALGSKTTTQIIGSGFVAIPSPGYITGLTANRTYYFRLVAENQYGRVVGSQYSFQTSSNTPPPVGSTPTVNTSSASSISRTGATVAGQVDPNQAATQYWFEYGKTPNLGNTTAFSNMGSGNASQSASASLGNLDPMTTYYFRLNAQNQFGTINGAIQSFTTAGPATSTSSSGNTHTNGGTNTAFQSASVNVASQSENASVASQSASSNVASQVRN